MVLPMGTPELSDHREDMPEPWNHTLNQNTPRGHLWHKEMFKDLVTHSRRLFYTGSLQYKAVTLLQFKEHSP